MAFIKHFADSTAAKLMEWYTAAVWSEKDIPDLGGKTILVTGATDGVGFEAARAFASHGARVIIHGRNEQKTARVILDIKRYAAPNAELEMLTGDFTDFESVKAMADTYKTKGWSLHVLVNNAGMPPTGTRAIKTKERIEVSLASNHFGPLYLTFLLLDVIKASAPSRIVWVSALWSQLINPPYVGGNSWFPGIDWFFWPGMNWDDLKGSNYPDSDWWQYSRTKLANLMTGKEMGRRLQGTDVEVFVAHPGITKTEHYLKGGFGTKKSTSTIDTIVNYLATEPSTGAKPLMFAATELRIKGRTGAYIGPSELLPISPFPVGHIKRPNAPLASDTWACRRLLDASILILKEIDPELPNADISPDGKVLLDRNFARKVLPADGTSGKAAVGPHGDDIIGVHDAQHLTGRSAASIGRRPAPFLAALRQVLMADPERY